jgi:hypothetical protein
MNALARIIAAVALAALSVLAAGAAQARALNDQPGVQPISRTTDQTRAQWALKRVLAREHHAYPAPTDQPAETAQQALGRVLTREHNAYPAPADAPQLANSQQANPSNTIPLLPVRAVITVAGLSAVLGSAAAWRRLRARPHAREET